VNNKHDGKLSLTLLFDYYYELQNMIQFLTNMIYSNKADDVACKSPSSKACLKPLKKKKIHIKKSCKVNV
jgi:hypothetical protein